MPRIEFLDVGKRFGGTRALDGLTLTVESGECHALVGENGAGKSTLGRILAGIHAPDAGSVRLDGRRVSFRSPADARAAGVAMVHQELAFCPDLSVAENLVLGDWPVHGPGGLLVDRRAMLARARQRLEEIGVALDVSAPLSSLSTAQEQLVQIAAAVGTGASVLVFDEPTSSLTPPEAERLFALIARLRARGATILYVSHRLAEVEALADRISVLRDGRLIATLTRAAATSAGLVRLMLGHELADATPASEPQRPPARRAQDVALLSVEGLASPGRFSGISFTLRAGEIVGLAGLVGAGRSDVARALFGLDAAARGRVLVDGAPLRLGSPQRAIAAGLALVPEDRKRQGLVLSLGARANWSLPRLRGLPRWGAPALAALRLVDRGAERRAAAGALAAVGAEHAGDAALEQPVAALSGGNQQKVVLARWLSTGARVLIVDEPTRGVDVGAQAAIHELLRARARAGAGLLLISSELEELRALCDRLLVMRDGRLVGELSRADANSERLLRLMAGVAG